MKFFIQDPIFKKSSSLHEKLLEVCQDAIYGAGVFAFVTSGGVELFLGDKAFENFMDGNQQKFKLIVGIDEITNTRTLSNLKTMQDNFGQKLEVKVLLHPHNNVTFHPKFTWFKKEQGGVIIVGSNNLTEKGLRRNIEAFSINEVDENEILEIEAYFDEWLKENDKFLLSIDHEDVIKKAKENNKNFVHKKKVNDNNGEQGEESDTIDEVDFEAWTFSEQNQVLVAEIPKSKNRWKQANFDRATFETFFGATAGCNGHHRVILRSVDKRGFIQKIEVRPSVSVASKNYRFELDAAGGLAYPTEGRPIAVFINLSVRMYLYILAMPKDSFYNEIDTYIESLKGKNMVRHITTVQDIKKNCPNLPLWNIKK